MKRMETDKVIVIEKTGYRSEDFISCSGVTRCIRNHGYRGGWSSWKTGFKTR